MADHRDDIRAYHHRTKHHPQRFAAGPHGLDWAARPEPFRHYSGAREVALPLLGGGGTARLLGDGGTARLLGDGGTARLLGDGGTAKWADLYKHGAVPPTPLTLGAIGILFELTLGLSAWKAMGPERWALRCNPSSGNLHPTEGYLVTPTVPGLAPGVYHYVSRDHVLEHRVTPDPDRWKEVWAPQPNGVLIGLSSIHWREAWKYGERAFRYCQHDVGHAVAALSYAAGVLGWQSALLTTFSDDDLTALLALPRSDAREDPAPETPDCLLWVGPEKSEGAAPDPGRLAWALEGAAQAGAPNRLSSQRRVWEAIPRAEAAARYRASAAETGCDDRTLTTLPPLGAVRCVRAASLIRGRRSAQAFDPTQTLGLEPFLRILDATLPRANVPPFTGLGWAPLIHLCLFVHRVDGLAPGIYLLPRGVGGERTLRETLAADFAWSPVPQAPDHLALWQLKQADVVDLAAALCCRQEIAGDSSFSLGMLAEFDHALAQGDWWYRRLLWEAGVIGQVLYLEAELAGVRGTGIGCYFDDAVHQVLGITDDRIQSLYHFTVGYPVDDTRLTTLPPYAHLKR